MFHFPGQSPVLLKIDAGTLNGAMNALTGKSHHPSRKLSSETAHALRTPFFIWSVTNDTPPFHIPIGLENNSHFWICITAINCDINLLTPFSSPRCEVEILEKATFKGKESGRFSPFALLFKFDWYACSSVTLVLYIKFHNNTMWFHLQQFLFLLRWRNATRISGNIKNYRWN